MLHSRFSEPLNPAILKASSLIVWIISSKRSLRDLKIAISRARGPWSISAVSNTIAWTTFTPEMFARLYCSDLLIVSLFQNFLLAEHLMKGYNCTPHTAPPLPTTNTYLLWATWDLALDACIKQLPEMLASNKIQQQQQNFDIQKVPPYQYVPSRFFADQLTAFKVWISRGGSALTR
ncbi:hypothetical protein BT96DRAFT_1007395 [Gymnopus androsaceus JB14]|uniref:Uncharacterized protein n=1 Tax=Gymnopus androsaceus JB14 TaxID=1447944 RepID=A0A6A4GHH9_9AGAR|nr:hypothetical protein BT96DRAFT_1007395 [Gymnopus androsaceus JB14]